MVNSCLNQCDGSLSHTLDFSSTARNATTIVVTSVVSVSVRVTLRYSFLELYILKKHSSESIHTRTIDNM